jgi:hypothetical protein
MQTQPDFVHSGRYSAMETTIRDLIEALEHGDSVQEIATYLQYLVETVRAKMRELGSPIVPRCTVQSMVTEPSQG